MAPPDLLTRARGAAAFTGVAAPRVEPRPAASFIPDIAPVTRPLATDVLRGQGGPPQVAQVEAPSGRPEPTLLERAKAAASPDPFFPGLQKGAVSGLAFDLPIAGGIAGFLATAPVPIPGARVAGTALGIAAGGFLEEFIREEFGVLRAEELPLAERPAAFAGELLTAGGGIAALPLVAATRGARLAAGETRVGRFVSNFINRIIESAGKRPGEFAQGEARALTGGSDCWRSSGGGGAWKAGNKASRRTFGWYCGSAHAEADRTQY